MYSKGRIPILTNETKIDETNIREVIGKAMTIHFNNVADMHYLVDYEAGKQPILQRVKEVRPEINNRVVENHAHEIVDFKDGYEFGSPITYVQRAGVEPDESNEDEDNNTINKLNEMLFNEGKWYKDQELGNTLHIRGVAYRGAFPKKNDDKSLFDLINLPPETTFVVRSNDMYKKVMLGVSYRIDDELHAHFGAYTDTHYYELSGDIYATGLKIEKISVNGIGCVPIVEYKNDYRRMGSFERVLPLLDAINNCTSDRLNGLAQFIQNLIWFNNIDIDNEDFAALSELGAIKTKSSDGLNASIQTLNTDLNQTEIQTYADYLYDQVLQITGVPGREQSTGGNTGQALMLGGSGWQLAETAAKKTEQLFAECDRDMLKVISSIIEKSNDSEFKELDISDIEIKFSRNKVSNLLTKTQGLQNQLNAGIHPRIAIANCDLYSDPAQVYLDSMEFLEKWKTSTTDSSKDNTADITSEDKTVEDVKKTNEDGEQVVKEQPQVQPLD